MQRFPLAFHCVWFGALGGVIISLKGVYDHAVGRDAAWDNRFDLWHFGRPVSGAVTGLVTYVLLCALNQSGTPNQTVLYAAAFVLGTQES
jgi:hypothetical protein